MMAQSRGGPGWFVRARTWDVDIDRFLNPVIPAPRWHLVPTPIAHFLGHRSEPSKTLGNIFVAFWSLVGAFCGVALVSSISQQVPSFKVRDAPPIIGSFGAAAVLEFGTIESPLAQPRNAFFGQMIACLIGVGVTKLFALDHNAENYTSLGGALACGVTTALMLITKTVHPPAGATALLAVTNPEVKKLGWFLFPVMLLGITLMQAAALIINNIQRRFPLYWWTSQPLSRSRLHDEERPEKEIPSVPSHYDSDSEPSRRLVIERGDFVVPDGMFLSEQERLTLRRISQRL
ncbi:hypothetical protein N7468_008049 [Penicillium chermesinum]|uniref:HPP transmembrane region domain-containing protein n=1 Tax=Penicillium chermesinum TaxID=63820 RepID=A0A9W9NP08_9EURO|nr:uncharacterized protein N7468_008049 [Penicillium chermesinum]KAJ5223507.1 hypothetical protein N7468_008049 [Penicillium chermesinum]KAJ6155662.1 hypothetical protein N7470_006228 [Penicillium chermesinum]